MIQFALFFMMLHSSFQNKHIFLHLNYIKETVLLHVFYFFIFIFFTTPMSALLSTALYCGSDCGTFRWYFLLLQYQSCLTFQKTEHSHFAIHTIQFKSNPKQQICHYYYLENHGGCNSAECRAGLGHTFSLTLKKKNKKTKRS